MRSLPLVLALAACKSGGGTPEPGGGAQDITYHSAMADDQEAPPSYSKAQLDAMLDTEHKRLDAMLEAGDEADVPVRRRFIAMLELCRATGRYCPPRIDEPVWSYDVASDADPKLDSALRFDADSWRKVSAELHGRACACRTVDCVDQLEVAIARLEIRPMPEVQSDNLALVEIVRARDCLAQLRGRRQLPRVDVE